MPDISMCRNKTCPRRDKCYRYRAIPNEAWQSYSSYPSEGCTSFWDIEGRTNLVPIEELEKETQG